MAGVAGGAGDLGVQGVPSIFTGAGWISPSSCRRPPWASSIWQWRLQWVLEILDFPPFSPSSMSRNQSLFAVGNPQPLSTTGETDIVGEFRS